jgi:hypothetical protein
MKANIEIIDHTIMPRVPYYLHELGIGACGRVTSEGSFFQHIVMRTGPRTYFSFIDGNYFEPETNSKIECTRLKVDIKVHVLGEE